MFQRTKPIRLWINVETLPRLVRDLQYDSLAFMNALPIELNSAMDGREDIIQVRLSGWQVKKLEARIPKRTLEEEYP